MSSALQIAILTLKTALRSRVFIFLALLTAILAFGLPQLNIDNGKLEDIFRLRINYTISAIVGLLSCATLWLSSLDLSEDIESHRIQMILTKPVHPLSLWFGKVAGNSFLTCALLILGLLPLAWQSRGLTEEKRRDEGRASLHFIRHCKTYDEKDLPPKLRGLLNILTRRTRAILTKEEFDTYIDEPIMEFPADESLENRTHYYLAQTRQIEKMLNALLKGREKVAAVTDNKEGALEPGKPINCTFSGLPYGNEDPFHLRFRMYKYDKIKNVGYGIRIEFYDPEQKKFSLSMPFIGRATAFHNIVVDPRLIDRNGTLKLRLRNYDNTGTNLYLQPGDGPYILHGDMSFYENLLRCGFLAVLFLILMSALGTTAGALAKPLIAIFVSGSILLVSIIAGGLENSARRGLTAIYVNASKVFGADIEKFIPLEKLADGVAITSGDILSVVIVGFAFKFTFLAFIGWLALVKREFGMVKR